MSQRTIHLYFQLHQPFRVKRYTIFDVAHDHLYFNDEGESDLNNARVFQKVAEKSYRPMLALLERLLEDEPGFSFSLSLSGVLLEQAEVWAPDVIETLQRVVATGRVEILAETYHHSLAFFYSRKEFEAQVQLHREKISSVFGVVPSVFRNTELAYNNQLAEWASQRNYTAILAEGWDGVLDWRSPNHLYQTDTVKPIALMLKNYRLSDDLAFRFGDKKWSGWPLTPDKYASWIQDSDESATIINLFMDFETFGEHQWADTGIFEFFRQFVSLWLHQHGSFATISETLEELKPVDTISMPDTVTWADTERDLSAWNGNALQREALRYIYALEQEVVQTHDKELIEDWRKLLTSDHTYYMSTKWHDDGSIHSYFSPYDSPYDAFLFYMNTVRDLRWRIMQHRRVL